MDKKQKDIIISTMIKTFIVIYIVIFVIGIVKLFRGYSPAECFWELLLIFIMPVAGYFFLTNRRKAYFPVRIAGLRVRPKQTRKALKGRIKAYILDSLQYAIVISLLIFCLDIWDAHSAGTLSGYGVQDWLGAVGRMLLQLMGFFAGYFAIDFVIYETKAKKYMEQRRRRERRKKKYREELMGTTEEPAEGTTEDTMKETESTMEEAAEETAENTMEAGSSSDESLFNTAFFYDDFISSESAK